MDGWQSGLSKEKQMSFKTKLAEKRALHSNALCRYKLGAASLILGGLFLTSACTTTRGNPNHDAVSQVIRDSGPAQPATTVSSNTTETSNNGSRGRQLCRVRAGVLLAVDSDATRA